MDYEKLKEIILVYHTILGFLNFKQKPHVLLTKKWSNREIDDFVCLVYNKMQNRKRKARQSTEKHNAPR